MVLSNVGVRQLGQTNMAVALLAVLKTVYHFLMEFVA